MEVSNEISWDIIGDATTNTGDATTNSHLGLSHSGVRGDIEKFLALKFLGHPKYFKNNNKSYHYHDIYIYIYYNANVHIYIYIYMFVYVEYIYIYQTHVI